LPLAAAEIGARFDVQGLLYAPIIRPEALFDDRICVPPAGWRQRRGPLTPAPRGARSTPPGPCYP